MKGDFERNFREDMKIDIHNLHISLREHSDIHLYWGERLAEATKERDLALVRQDRQAKILKEKLAELALLIKKNPDSYGLTSSSDAIVQSAALTHPDYTKERIAYFDVSNEVAELQEQVNLLETVKWTIVANKDNMAELVKLWLAGYYDSPNVTSEEVKVMREVAEKRTKEAHYKALNETGLRLRKKEN